MKPILFNTEMVRAILDGRKTQTRRVIKPQHLRVLNSPYHQTHPDVPDKTLLERLCYPPHNVGDILYVRETWKVQSARRFDADVRIMFKAGGPMATIQFPGGRSWETSRDEYDAFVARWQQGDGWHPSIHMPKEAARLFLRVTDVRAERLRDIDGAGIKAEGTEGKHLGLATRGAFSLLWDSTIKPADRDRCGWAANPWVWVICFERCEKPEETDNGM